MQRPSEVALDAECTALLIRMEHIYGYQGYALCYYFPVLTECLIGHQLGVKHLWAYFILDQILPVSYTQNLFLIAISLMDLPSSKQLRQAPGLTRQLAPLLAYMVCLIAMPYCVGTSWFFPVLFLTRFLLFSRMIELRPGVKPESSEKSASVTPAFPLFEDYKWTIVYFCLGAWVLSVVHLTQAMPFQGALAAVNFNSAVSALGYDLLVGLASLVITAVS